MSKVTKLVIDRKRGLRGEGFWPSRVDTATPLG